MSELVKLVEIFEIKSLNSKGTHTSEKDFSIRNIYVNPGYVILMRENERYKAFLENKKMIEGLDDCHQFTQLTLASDNKSSHNVTVVGDPDTIFKKIHRKRKKNV